MGAGTAADAARKRFCHKELTTDARTAFFSDYRMIALEASRKNQTYAVEWFAQAVALVTFLAPPQPRTSLARNEDDRFVGRPARLPCDSDLFRFAGADLLVPGHNPAPVADVLFGRWRHRRQQLDLDVVDFTHRNLVFDDNPDRHIMA